VLDASSVACEGVDVKYTAGAVLAAPILIAHDFLYKRSGGRIGHRSLGVPTLLLTTTGRRTGLRRAHALVYARDGERYVVVASNGGNDRPPAWLLNAQAHPDVEVQIGRDTFAAVAHVAGPDERPRLWELVNRNNRGLAPLLHRGALGRYDVYQQHTDREIALLVLTPAPT
jgi:deazaflavin-dependent oxidoreductase (nitroreductase family)